MTMREKILVLAVFLGVLGGCGQIRSVSTPIIRIQGSDTMRILIEPACLQKRIGQERAEHEAAEEVEEEDSGVLHGR